eukprot:TRINITY_DN3643_c0_g1_i2.p1 TRINITY_DN3643_c0_g1~~TRINITY_DN3643_c0_g1_i2.p1  ORF type:complete len:128 (+),score=31.13 TRINITY_DN3643_c0_g1_i2:134-517(+)
MIRRPPRSTLSSSSAASDVYKRQFFMCVTFNLPFPYSNVHPSSTSRIRRDMRTFLRGSRALEDPIGLAGLKDEPSEHVMRAMAVRLSLIHISEPTRLLSISYAVFCLKKKKKARHKIQEYKYIHAKY